MKKLLILLFLIPIICFGQITKTKIAKHKDEDVSIPYDSLTNFLGTNVMAYVGQDLYLIGKSKDLRRYGYRDFYTHYDKNTLSIDRSSIYKCKDNSFSSKYEDLAEKTFTVLSVSKHPKVDDENNSDILNSLYKSKYILKLLEKESRDTVYYEYSADSYTSFPFLTVGYFEKIKPILIGQKFVSRGKNWITTDSKMYNIKDGAEMDYSAGTIFKCVDVTIDEEYYNFSAVLENSKGEQTFFSIDSIYQNYFLFTKSDADRYKSKYGATNWSAILNRTVIVGFTKEMCTLSWGKPKEVNRSSSGDQWVYDDHYLYFKGNILTAFN